MEGGGSRGEEKRREGEEKRREEEGTQRGEGRKWEKDWLKSKGARRREAGHVDSV